MSSPTFSSVSTRSSSETAAAPFLSSNEKEELQTFEDLPVYHKRKSWLRRNYKAIIWHTNFTIFTFVLMFFGLGDLITSKKGGDCLCESPVYNPGKPFLKHEIIDLHFSDGDTNPFKHLTDAADKQWHDLMDYTYVRLTDEDLEEMNETSVPLGDGGWLGMPVMFHEVHCVKILRWAVNMDRYSYMFGERDLVDLYAHTEHCLDVLRQSIMCKADLSPVPFYWVPEKRIPHSEFISPHHCAKWDSVMDYLTERHVQVNEPGVLNHPIYGPSYPGEQRLDEKWDTPQVLPPIKYTGPMAL